MMTMMMVMTTRLLPLFAAPPVVSVQKSGGEIIRKEDYPPIPTRLSQCATGECVRNTHAHAQVGKQESARPPEKAHIT